MDVRLTVNAVEILAYGHHSFFTDTVRLTILLVLQKAGFHQEYYELLRRSDMPKEQGMRVVCLKPFIHLVCVDVAIVV